MSEKRNFSRVDFEKDVEVISQGAKYRGEIKNISLKGAFVKTPQQLRMGDRVELIIHLAGKAGLDINLMGKVVWTTEDGSGIMFDQINLDSFAHLRNIIAYNLGDDDQIMEEFFNYLNQKTNH